LTKTMSKSLKGLIVFSLRSNTHNTFHSRCSLERDLAERFCHEAQLQAYHYARALANLAEMYGRMGVHDEAFKYFDVMKAVYMTQDHPKLLLEGYGE
jgi:hypothetical protein